MREIVLESGMSQGGVYKYFPNIDSVFVAILNETALGTENRDEVNRILSMDASPVGKLEALFDYLRSYLEATLRERGSIWIELMELYAREPERFSQIRDQLAEVSALEYVQDRLRAFLIEGVASGAFKPEVPVEHILSFIHASIHGITDTFVRQSHQIRPRKPNQIGDARVQFAVLSRAVAKLMSPTPLRRLKGTSPR